ncbi:hypothetical protein [Pseudomonas syringae]|uniref:hypothetical protein n=1 Tax=Pseudomonas syringae TaxID=317 RepID=UPI001F0FD198|nr:hypothetical protein [Pseudomonas syringae]MCH5555053.1 hypothetical protein [Pseudomonas syringae pv. syringae]MCH5574613.1 hypothetical protein [Pseudomonas syringae pv. syringae]MCH5666709.1 hypothetical protein [Pseudomonas syringae pv. syringae]
MPCYPELSGLLTEQGNKAKRLLSIFQSNNGQELWNFTTVSTGLNFLRNSVLANDYGLSGGFCNTFPAVLNAGFPAVVMDDGKKFQQRQSRWGVRYYSRILTPV